VLAPQRTAALVTHSTQHAAMATRNTAQQREELLAATFAKWPGNSAAARAKRAAAAYLLRCPFLGANSSHIATAVKRELGATQQCGLGPFRQLLQQDDCFSVQQATPEAWIELLPDRWAHAPCRVGCRSTAQHAITALDDARCLYTTR
jgi:hypothetical protein